MAFKSYYDAVPPDPPDLYEEICIKHDCQYLNDDGECVIDCCPGDCGKWMDEEAEAWRDLGVDRKIDERRMEEE